MRRQRDLGVVAGALLLAGCFATTSGWFRADLEPRIAGEYAQRFAPLDLDPRAPCSELARHVRDRTTPIIVLVPGAGGDGKEMQVALATLMIKPPASIFMYRWVPFDPRDAIADGLAAGVSRLAECLPGSEGRLLVVSHSAAGVIGSFAASRVRLPPRREKRPWVTVLTVAAPLAGFVRREAKPDGGAGTSLLSDLGTQITGYPEPAPGVRVVHLRTEAPDDGNMTSFDGLAPNDPSVGVPGAPQLELPRGLDHSAALEYVATEIASGRWTVWRDGR